MKKLSFSICTRNATLGEEGTKKVATITAIALALALAASAFSVAIHPAFAAGSKSLLG